MDSFFKLPGEGNYGGDYVQSILIYYACEMVGAN